MKEPTTSTSTKERGRVRLVGVFLVGLGVAIPLGLVLWGIVLPWYAEVVGWGAFGVLRGVLRYPLEGVRVTPEGVLNTQTHLALVLKGRAEGIDFGALAFNVPPFVALMALSPGLGWRRKLRGLAVGLEVLVAGHFVYVVLSFVFAGWIARSPDLPTVVGELFLSLPFLLWVVLGYWERVRRVLSGGGTFAG